jgi:hypothetical protein
MGLRSLFAFWLGGAGKSGPSDAGEYQALCVTITRRRSYTQRRWVVATKTNRGMSITMRKACK